MPTRDINKRHIHQATYYARHREAIKERRAEYFKQYPKTETGKKKKLLNYYEMTRRYPEKYKARYTLRNAVRLGKINKGCCEICGALDVEAHHDDYSKPLEVRWFCSLHHRELEGRLIPYQNLKQQEGVK